MPTKLLNWKCPRAINKTIFNTSPADSGKMEAQLNFPSAPHLMPTRGKKSDME